MPRHPALLAPLALAIVLALSGTPQAATCAADVAKAQGEWTEIKKKADSGAIEIMDKEGRSLEGVLRRAGEASQQGKNKLCVKLLKTLRGRWQEKGWQ